MKLKSKLLLGLLVGGMFFACPFAKADDLYGAIPADSTSPKLLPSDSTPPLDVLPDVQNKISPSNNTKDASATNGGNNSYQSEKLKNAVTNIDGAQINLRTQITTYKKQLDEINTRFKAVKNERKLAKDKIRKAENRLKQMESAKKKINENIN